MDKVDATMATVNEQRELANEIAETISGPMYTPEYDEVGLVLYLYGISRSSDCL
jgi:hypothetical protein